MKFSARKKIHLNKFKKHIVPKMATTVFSKNSIIIVPKLGKFRNNSFMEKKVASLVAQNNFKYKKFNVYVIDNKKIKKNKQIFLPNEELSQSLKVLKFKEALSNGDLIQVYQPIADCASGQSVSCEALVRWEHTGLMRSPDYFMPIAEEQNLLQELDTWSIKKAIQALVFLRKNNKDITIAVNISSSSLFNLDLKSLIVQEFKANDIQISGLTLELTETQKISDILTAKTKISELINLGIKVSLDDFGTGYSSLLYLMNFPVYKIKIDKQFLDDFHLESNAKIVKSLCDLAASLGIEVVAEGVESPSQWDFLKKLNCTYVQGYLHSRPLTLEALSAFL